MRKWILLIWCLLMAVGQAAGEELPILESGENGQLWYASVSEAVDANLDQYFDLEALRALWQNGAQANAVVDACVLPQSSTGQRLVCLRYRWEKGRFGEYEKQMTQTALVDMDTGENVGLEAVFADLDQLQTVIDRAIEDKVMSSMNTYLDFSNLLPTSLENLWLNDGVTVYYPEERFVNFSGEAGAIHLGWYELLEIVPDWLYQSPDQEEVFAAAAQGRFPQHGADSLYVGCDLTGLLEQCDMPMDADFVTGGEIYTFEEESLRGYQAITNGSEALAVRATRFDLNGVRVGMTRDVALAALGMPALSVELTAEAAEGLRLQAGQKDVYQTGEYELALYYDENDVVYAAEISGGM